MPTTLYFIRHGELDNPGDIIYGRNIDMSLSDHGKQQILSLATTLRDEKVKADVLFVSPLRRTQQSAQIIFTLFPRAPIMLDDRLLEVDLPVLTTRTLEWQESIGGDVYNHAETKGLVESPVAITERMLSVTNMILRLYNGKTIFVVSHGDPLAFMMYRLLHPRDETPKITALKEYLYLLPGEAWKTTFDTEGRVLSNTHIKIGTDEKK